MLDLGQARPEGPEVELEIYNLFGTVTVIAPPGIAVDVSGGGAFASQVLEPPAWHEALNDAAATAREAPVRSLLVSGETRVGKTSFLRILAKRLERDGWSVFEAGGGDYSKDGGERLNGKSLLNLLTMAADQGTVVHLEVAGPDCEEALAALVEVLERTYTDE